MRITKGLGGSLLGMIYARDAEQITYGIQQGHVGSACHACGERGIS